MSTAEMVEQLKRMSNPERQAVIEAASQLVREGGQRGIVEVVREGS